MTDTDSPAPGFGNPPLGAMVAVGAVTPGSARIWYRAPGPGSYRLRWRPREGGDYCGERAMAVDNPEADFTGSLLISEGLDSDQFYRVVLEDSEGAELAEGTLRTSPVEGHKAQHFAIGFLSCHQPFDKKGDVMPTSEPMLAAMHHAFRQHDVRQVILGGDQMYSDFPESRSLFDEEYFARVAPPGRHSVLECSAQEVRSLFHRRYRHFWNIRGWRELLANYPCYPVIDDHDIVDNWGSAVEHTETKWKNFRRGAFQAYCDYQGALVADPVDEPPEDLDFVTTQANSATYVLDIRSNRRVGEDPRIVSDRQLHRLREFLRFHNERDVLFIVVSVPIIHLPKAMSQLAARLTPDGEDFSDRWSSEGHRLDRGRVLRLIHDHQGRFPNQRVVLLSGDIHIGCLHQIHWPDRQPNLYQFVSSGITHDAGFFIQTLSGLIIRCKHTLDVEDGPSARVKLRRGLKGARWNPCSRVNFGVVEVTRRTPEAQPELEFFLYSHDGDEPVRRYRSGLV